MIDFAETDDQRAFGAAVEALVDASGERGADDASPALWDRLAEVGALGLLTDDAGDVRDLVTLMRAIGRSVCPGPVLSTVTSALVLPEPLRHEVAEGSTRVSLAVDGRVPWGSSVDHVLALDRLDACLVDVVPGDPVPTLSREPWCAVRATGRHELAGGTALAVALDLGLGAALLGMAARLLDQAAAHVATREQFGRPIGTFQAVAHPLANAWAAVTATEELLRLVATEAAAGMGDPDRSQLARWQSRDAALQTAYSVHQAMGGLSFADESGVGTVSTRIRQWSYLVPDRTVAGAGHGR